MYLFSGQLYSRVDLLFAIALNMNMMFFFMKDTFSIVHIHAITENSPVWNKISIICIMQIHT